MITHLFEYVWGPNLNMTSMEAREPARFGTWDKGSELRRMDYLFLAGQTLIKMAVEY